MHIYRVIHAKKLIVPLLCILFIVFLVLFSESSLQAARKGLNIWLNTVLPSLLPFLVVSEMLKDTSFIKKLERSLNLLMRPVFNLPGHSSIAYVLGLASGYPAGAKITSSMYKDGLITKNEAERQLAISNNAGPLFITGAVATGIFRMPGTGVILLVCHIAAGILTGIILNIFMSEKNRYNLLTYKKVTTQKAVSQNPGTAFVRAVSSSVNTLLMVGGFIIFFSVVIELLSVTGIIRILASVASLLLPRAAIITQSLEAVFSGVIEITTGINMLGGMTQFPLDIRIASAAFMLGWGGISVHFQVYGIISGTGIGMRKYAIGKFIHGLIGSVITYVCVKLLYSGSSLPVIAPVGQPEVYNFPGVLLFSICYMAVSLLIMLSFLLFPGFAGARGKQ